MTQQQPPASILPILIILPVLYFRMRRMTEAAAAEAEPAVDPAGHLLVIAALALLAPRRRQPQRLVAGLRLVGAGGVLGAVGGW